MRREYASLSDRSARTAASIAGAYAVIGGCLTLIGWTAQIQRLTDWRNDGISMFPNTAVCAVMCGIGLLVLNNLSLPKWRNLVRAMGGMTALVGGLTLFEHLSGVGLRIDDLLFHQTWGMRAAAAPMRMGPPASLSFLMIGCALILLTSGSRARAVAAGLGTAVTGIAMLSITGYLYGAQQMYTLPRLTGIAMQTASIILGSGIGLLASAPDREPVRTILQPGTAGTLARRLIPLIVLLALVLGWLRVLIQQHHLADTAFSTALRTQVEIVLLIGLLWWAVVMVRAHEGALHQSEVELRQQSGQLAAFLETAAICLHRAGPDGTILWANEAELKTFGYSRDEYVGRNIAEFHVDQTLIASILARLHQGEKMRDCEARIRCKDGSIKSVLIDSSVLWDEGRFVHTQCFTRDITERKRTEEELAESVRRKDEFLAMLAHELRNPLAPLRNGLELLRVLPEDDPKALEQTRAMMQRQLSHLVRLVDDLLDASRITRGKLQLRRERVELAPLLHEAVNACRAQVEAAGLHIDVSVPPDSIPLDADPVRLAQVLGNILGNAVKFTEPGGRIWLEAQRDGNSARITVRDSGIGIPGEMLGQVFEMFAQVDRSLERARGGLGIGLTLARRLVEMHGGTLTAHSDGLGRGSEFIVRLPVLVEGAEIRADAPVAAPAVGTGAQSASTHRRILVVDDNRDSARSLAKLLALSGSRTEVAHDGEEAVEKAQQYLPDIVLLDIGLPKMNGYDACCAIRQKLAGRKSLIVALTGWGQDDFRQRSKDAGFDAHVVKPVDGLALTRLLDSLWTADSFLSGESRATAIAPASDAPDSANS